MSCQVCSKSLSPKEKENFITYCQICAMTLKIKSRKEMAKIKKSAWFQYYNTGKLGDCMSCKQLMTKDQFECITADNSNNFELTNVKLVCPECYAKTRPTPTSQNSPNSQKSRTDNRSQHKRGSNELDRPNNLFIDRQQISFNRQAPPFGYISVFNEHTPSIRSSDKHTTETQPSSYSCHQPSPQPCHQPSPQPWPQLQLIPVWNSNPLPLLFPQWWYCQLYKLQQYPQPWYESYSHQNQHNITQSQNKQKTHTDDIFGVASMEIDWKAEC